MNAKITIEMQNAFGRFIQLYHLNRVSEAIGLFTHDAVFWMPDIDIKATGTEEIAQTLKQLQEKRIAAGSYRDVHMPHTPCFDTTENDTVGLATWDTHSFYITKGDDGKDKIEYDYGRIDGRFKEEDGQWKFCELDWWDVESFVPWEYDPQTDDSWVNMPENLPAPPQYIGKTTVRDFYAVQNMISRHGQNNRKYAFEDTFANRDDVTYRGMPFTNETVKGVKAVQAELDRLDAMEEKNDGLYVYVPGTGAPVIELSEDGETINAQWMVSTNTFEGKAFGINEPPYMYVRRVGFLTVRCVKENGQWRVLNFDINQILTVPGF
ncbi:MAG: nuclear transport factor 2 family protein, partial [Erysipelotrichaceae bacterium]|nr:nuclear transport factor 2 family protein [Erysipelotrichaceae bacterium]